MIPVLVVAWCVCAPMAYLVGDVFAHRFPNLDGDTRKALPLVAVVFPPVGALLALILLFVETQKESEEE